MGVRVVILTALTYVGVYLAVSRYSLSLMRPEHIDCFYYAPVDVKRLMDSGFWQAVHSIGTIVFYPAWRIDHAFGGPGFGYVPSPGISDPVR